jgi:hypothetical protein
MKKLLCLILIVSVLFCSCKRQTKTHGFSEGSIVIGITTPNYILLSADSRQLNLLDGTFHIINRVCKVHQKDSMIWGSVGVISGYDSEGNYINIPNIIKNKKLTSSSMEGKLFELRDTLKKVIQSLLKANSLETKKPNGTQVIDTAVGSYIFADFENDKPTVGIIGFRLRKDDKNRMYLYDSSGVAKITHPMGFFALGHKNVVDSVITVNRNYFKEHKILEGIQSLITLQSLHTMSVNDTINIIGIDPKNRIKWLVKNFECN